MSKIICDVCGTVYPDTATQCPICGCAKLDNAQVVETEGVEETQANAGGYTYVKGGRFSKANVRKRNKAMPVPTPVEPEEPEEEETSETSEDREEKPQSNRGLVITAIVLLLAIIAVVIYIFLRFFAPSNTPKVTAPATTQPAVAAPTAAQTVPPDTSVHCTTLILSDSKISFTEAGQHWILDASAEPANTTDPIVFRSSNDAIATVTQDGRVTAVATGDAVITVTCGSISAQCEVKCLILGVNPPEDAQTPPPEITTPTEATQAETEPQHVPQDSVPVGATMRVLFYGETREDNDVSLATGSVVDVTLEDYDGNEADIVWVSDDPDICRVDGSTFEAINPGYVEVKTTYRGIEYVCIIRVY